MRAISEIEEEKMNTASKKFKETKQKRLEECTGCIRRWPSRRR